MSRTTYLSARDLPRSGLDHEQVRQVLAQLPKADRWPRRPSAGPVPIGDGDVSWTADHVIDEPREPVIVPIGVLDSRGEMLVRITMPIKQRMGFNTGSADWRGEVEDTVETVIAQDMVSVSDCGAGIAHIEPHECEGEDECEGDEEDGDDDLYAVVQTPTGPKKFKLVPMDDEPAPGVHPFKESGDDAG